MSLKIIKAEDLKPGDRYIYVFNNNDKFAWQTEIRTYPEAIAGGFPVDAEVVLLPPLKPTWPTEKIIRIDEGVLGIVEIAAGTLGFRQPDGQYRLINDGLYLGTVWEDDNDYHIDKWHEVDIVISPEGRSAHE